MRVVCVWSRHYLIFASSEVTTDGNHKRKDAQPTADAAVIKKSEKKFDRVITKGKLSHTVVSQFSFWRKNDIGIGFGI